MPDSHSPQFPGFGEDLAVKPLEGEPDRTLRRKWWCPGDHTVAAYADGVLGERRRSRIESHLSACLRCRLLVADAVKAQRESDVAPAPVHLIQKARELGVRRRLSRLWLGVPAGALAGIAMLVAVTMTERKPEPTIARPVQAPAAPLIARSEPLLSPLQPVPDVVRNRRIPEFVPTILSPQPGSVIRSNELQFSWKPIPRSRTYEVRVVKPDGDLIWEGDTPQSALQVPSDVALQDGSYFVWVTASLEDGKKMKSAPVRFLVQRSH